MATREQIYGALFALVPNNIFAYSSRQVKLFEELPAQPALCQAEHSETFTQVSRLPYKRVYKATWLIYFTSNGQVPVTIVNPILDAIEAAIAPPITDPGYMEERNTLGGLAWHCFIDGSITKVPGDLDGQGIVVIPISILVP